VGKGVSSEEAAKSNRLGRAWRETESPVLHRAQWLVPVNSPPIQDGAVLVKGKHILAVGPYSQVRNTSPSGATLMDHGSAAIMPGLVNAHTHLELSDLQGHIALPKERFALWLEEILSLRPSMDFARLQTGLLAGQRQLIDSGCCLCGDITNGTSFKTQNLPLVRQVFLEVLGFNRKNLAEALGPDLDQTTLGNPAAGGPPPSLAAHACYSASGEVIREAKEWCRTRVLPLSIHVAEHLEEIEFLESGSGFCRRVLEDLGRWAPHWAPPGTTPVRYLEQLQVLDSQTLLVHAVHLTARDWEIVQKHRCPVCFCPRSNLNLNVGRPDIARALHYGLVTALGTDSLASNLDLNLFAEAVYVLENYPDVPPEAVFLMMTLGGAKALGQEQHFGSIETGKQAPLLVVYLPDGLPLKRLFETTIQQGSRGAWQWAHHPVNGCD
jgi:aminodeoxyfutalosine deaminase